MVHALPVASQVRSLITSRLLAHKEDVGQIGQNLYLDPLFNLQGHSN